MTLSTFKDYNWYLYIVKMLESKPYKKQPCSSQQLLLAYLYRGIWRGLTYCLAVFKLYDACAVFSALLGVCYLKDGKSFLFIELCKELHDLLC